MYDIEGFISRQFEDYKFYGNPPSDISICCPFCDSRGSGDDTKYHLNVHLDSDKQVVHCFRCGYSSNWIQFVIDVTGFPYWQARGELYVTPNVREDMKEFVEYKFDHKPLETISKTYDLPHDFMLMSDFRNKGKLMREARIYLHRRGIQIKDYWKYNFGVAPSIGYRVIIPIEKGYWQGRAMYNWITPKYLNPKLPARDILFNAGALNLYNEVVVCEGAFSAMAVGDNAIALIGKEPTVEKTHRLVSSEVETFIIALEENAFPSMSILADSLAANGKKVIIWGYKGLDDPADNHGYSVKTYDLKTKVSYLLK